MIYQKAFKPPGPPQLMKKNNYDHKDQHINNGLELVFVDKIDCNFIEWNLHFRIFGAKKRKYPVNSQLVSNRF